MSSPDWTVLDWPVVSAVVRGDGTADVTIGGTSTHIDAVDVADARDQVTAHIVTHTAARLGRTVRVHTTDPDGTWWLLVHPDGTVDAGDPPAHPTGLLVNPTPPPTLPPSRRARRGRRRDTAPTVAPPSIRRLLTGPRVIAVTNPRGGTYTTTSVLQLAHVLASAHRTLAWDTTVGGSLAQRSTHTPSDAATSSDLQSDLVSLDSGGAPLHLDQYVHTQPAGYDVLPGPVGPVDASMVAAALRRYYDLIVCDTSADGVGIADQLVLTITVREDSALAVSQLLDRLQRDGHADLVAGAITLIAPHSPAPSQPLLANICDHFGRRTHTVIDLPYEPALAGGGRYYPQDHSTATRLAWQTVAAAILDAPHRPSPGQPDNQTSNKSAPTRVDADVGRTPRA